MKYTKTVKIDAALYDLSQKYAISRGLVLKVLIEKALISHLLRLGVRFEKPVDLYVPLGEINLAENQDEKL